MGLLSMNSTRKNILDNMKLEISDNLFESATCDCNAITSTLKIYSQNFNTVDEEIEALKTEISNIKTNYATTTLLNRTITVLETRISNLETRVTKLENILRITLKVGDYVQMTPASKSYTIAAEDTGCTTSGNCDSGTDQTINPSELTLWRVIRVNDDNTYDAVSVYTSSTTVEFYGKTGYQKLVGTLNKIAKQYENSTYTTGSRMMGYNGQTETIAVSLTTSNSGTSCTSSSTTAEQEAKGAGDTWYTTDTGLVYNVFGTLTAYPVNDTSARTFYWLASRRYFYDSSTRYYWSGWTVQATTGVAYDNLFYYGGYSSFSSPANPVRPIITLKSGLYARGSGTETNPYVLK
jgi:hypothetical protein